MKYFKSNQIRDQGMGLRFFVLCFKICTCGVASKLRVGFLGFSVLALFEKSLQIYFLRVNFLNHLQ